jgi:hypothetical protein
LINLLISCDQSYYELWGETCLKSIQKFSPAVKLHANIVNATKIEELPGVKYHYDSQEFSSEDHRIGYLQCSRFIKSAELFQNKEPVVTIDCDTICWREITVEQWNRLSSNIYVLRHHKKPRWLAGLVSFGRDNSFREDLKKRLLEFPFDRLRSGIDQKVLRNLSETYEFHETIVGDIMSFYRGHAPLVTFKGEQKDHKESMLHYHTVKRSLGL